MLPLKSSQAINPPRGRPWSSGGRPCHNSQMHCSLHNNSTKGRRCLTSPLEHVFQAVVSEIQTAQNKTSTDIGGGLEGSVITPNEASPGTYGGI